MGIKAIVMDIDGTLNVYKKGILPKTKEILLKAQKQGIKLILASGRPTTGMIDFGKALELEKNGGILISYNGSKVTDMETMKELYNMPLSIEDGKAVLEHIKKFDVSPMIDKGEYMYVNNVFERMVTLGGKKVNIVEYEARNGKYMLCEQADLAAFADFSLNKILVAGEPEYLQANYKAMMEPFEEFLNCMFTASVYFEFTAKHIDKAKALDTVLAQIGMNASEVIAFGDGQNDISLIQYAGIGVAMGNAVAELKAVADKITLSNEEDGIASCLLETLECLK
jgi:HAD-superfamily hydrolase, subfamily IIB